MSSPRLAITPTRTVLFLFLGLPVLAAVLLQRYMFAGLTAPPSDFGTGSMFDAIAVRYDMINRALALGMDTGWRERMVAKIAESVSHLQHPPLLLDVATGTADVALLLARALPEAKIIGVDPSRHMLHIGRQKVEQRGHRPETIRLLVHDAQDDFANVLLLDHHDDDDDTAPQLLLFDGATMSFGIRNVPDRAKALCQIHRALREGARLCILEFSEPADNAGFLGAVARLFIRHVVPVLGGLLSGKPREYWHLQHSIQDFPSPREFSMLLENLSERCDDGAYRLEELVQMNFGSVQLYVATVVRNHGQEESAKQLLVEKDMEEKLTDQ